MFLSLPASDASLAFVARLDEKDGVRRKIEGVRETVQEAQSEGAQSASAAKAKLSALRAAMGGGAKAYGKLKEDYKGAGTFSSSAANSADVAATKPSGMQELPQLPAYSASAAAAAARGMPPAKESPSKGKPWWLCCC